MKYGLCLAAVILILSGCGKKDNSSQSEPPQVTCVQDSLPVTFYFFNVGYKKSKREVCSNGCEKYTALSDPNIKDQICE